MDRRTFLFSLASAVACPRSGRAGRPAVRVGVLLPLTGDDQARGRMVRDAILLAIDELNRRPAQDRHPIVALIEDSRSDPKIFGRALRRFAGPERVASIFGLCPDGARTDLLRVTEKSDALFWDPAPTAGGVCSKHVIHGGPTPHQSLKHLVPWTMEQVGRRVLLVGGSGAYPRELVRVCAGVLERVGGEPLGKPLLMPSRGTDFTNVIERIAAGGVDAVFSALVGAQAAALLRQVKEAGIDPRRLPVVSPTLSEIEVAAAGRAAVGQVAAQPWFSSWVSPESWRFMDRMRRRHGGRVAPSALAEAAWAQMHLFAEALKALADGDVHPMNIREAAKEREVAVPQGRVRIESDSLHAVLWPKIAVVDPSGRFKILARAGREVRPLPFWAYKRQACTDAGLRHLSAEKQRLRAKVLPGRSE